MNILKIILNYYPSISECARALKISDVAIHQWQRRGQVPAKRAIQIEKDTNGIIKRSLLCPEFWPPR